MSDPQLIYRDRDGRQMTSVQDWVALFEDWSYRMIGDDFDLAKDRRVVTVWTGIDHEDPFRTDDPNIFSTAVFDMDGTEIGALVDEKYWPTLAKAREGHSLMVAKYLMGQP